MIKLFEATLLGVILSITSWLFYMQITNHEISLGTFSDTFLSIQLALTPTNGECLKTDGTDNYWDSCAAGSSPWTDEGAILSTTNSEGIRVSWITSTSTATTSTFAGQVQMNATTTWGSNIHPIAHGFYALDSSGLHLHSSNGTEAAYFGAGGGANITFPGYTSALLQTGASGAVEEYSGTTCTNQFTRALSALGIATCESVAPTDLSAADFGDYTCNGTTCSFDANTVQDSEIDYTAVTLADFTNDAGFLTGNQTITLSGDVTGSGATSITTSIASGVIIEPDLDADNSPNDGDVLTYDTTGTNFVWETILTLVNSITGAVDWGAITSLEIPNGINPTVDATGEIAVETDVPSISFYDGSLEQQLSPYFDLSFQLASTTKDTGLKSFDTATTTFFLRNQDGPVTLAKQYCKTNAGTLSVNVGDGTNWADQLIANSSGVEDTSIASNSTFNDREDIQVRIGSGATSPNRIQCTLTFRRTP